MDEWKTFFEAYGGLAISAEPYRDTGEMVYFGEPPQITLEALYLAFKQRIAAELIAALKEQPQ